jgi:hypothetical protein
LLVAFLPAHVLASICRPGKIRLGITEVDSVRAV